MHLQSSSRLMQEPRQNEHVRNVNFLQKDLCRESIG
jgi:hypothetical protein